MPSERPAIPAVVHDADDILSDMPLQHGAPRHERKIPRPFDERMAPAIHFDGAPQLALYRFVGFGLSERNARLIR